MRTIIALIIVETTAGSGQRTAATAAVERCVRLSSTRHRDRVRAIVTYNRGERGWRLSAKKYTFSLCVCAVDLSTLRNVAGRS